MKRAGVITPKAVSTVSKTDSVKPSQCHVCPIREDTILDDSNGQKGQDSIFCHGDCNTWLHRGCAGLSKKAFRALKDSEKPFYCVSCRLSIHSDEIECLKSSLKLLQEEMGSLKSSINVVDGGISPSVPPSHTATAGSVSTVSRPVLQKTSHPSKVPDRKFNIVVYGLDESVQGTSRRERKLQDTKKV